MDGNGTGAEPVAAYLAFGLGFDQGLSTLQLLVQVTDGVAADSITSGDVWRTHPFNASSLDSAAPAADDIGVAPAANDIGPVTPAARASCRTSAARLAAQGCPTRKPRRFSKDELSSADIRSVGCAAARVNLLT